MATRGGSSVPQSAPDHQVPMVCKPPDKDDVLLQRRKNNSYVRVMSCVGVMGLRRKVLLLCVPFFFFLGEEGRFLCSRFGVPWEVWNTLEGVGVQQLLYLGRGWSTLGGVGVPGRIGAPWEE